MKNFIHFLFTTTLSISALMGGETKAIDPITEEYEDHMLIVFDSEYDIDGYIVQASVFKDSGKIERFHIDDNGFTQIRQSAGLEPLKTAFWGTKTLFIQHGVTEIFMEEGFTKTLEGNEIFSLHLTDYSPEEGGILTLRYLEDHRSGSYAKKDFYLLKDNGAWVLKAEKNGQRIIKRLDVKAGSCQKSARTLLTLG